jgi:hypothetical protein
LEDSVKYKTIALDNLQTLVYQGVTYEIIPEVEGGISAKRDERDEERDEPQTQTP